MTEKEQYEKYHSQASQSQINEYKNNPENIDKSISNQRFAKYRKAKENRITTHRQHKNKGQEKV